MANQNESTEPNAEVIAVYPNRVKISVDDLSKFSTIDSQLEKLELSHEIHQYIINNHMGIFKECEIYVTLEPCNHVGKTPACANLISELGFKKVYIGSIDPNMQATGGIASLQQSNIDVEVAIEKEACDNLLYPFRKWIDGKFRFFKIGFRNSSS